MTRPPIVRGDIAEIVLTKGYSTFICASDLHLVGDHDWHATISRGKVYAARNVRVAGKRRVERLHRILLGATVDQEVDHEDGDGLNNLRSNLRIASRVENCRNRRLNKNNRSGLKGVVLHRDGRRYQSQIRVAGRKLHLGLFDTAEEAHAAYNQAARKYFGEFANAGSSA